MKFGNMIWTLVVLFALSLTVVSCTEDSDGDDDDDNDTDGDITDDDDDNDDTTDDDDDTADDDDDTTDDDDDTTDDDDDDVIPEGCDHYRIPAEDYRATYMEILGYKMWDITATDGLDPMEQGFRVATRYTEGFLPGAFPIEVSEGSWATCKFCFVAYADCFDLMGTRVCRTYMPIPGEGKYRFRKMGVEIGAEFAGGLEDVRLQEVTIDPNDGTTTIVDDGKIWCMDELNWDLTLDDHTLVDMDQPNGSCNYPAPPYNFIGPVSGNDPAPGTMPPINWPGAIKGDEVVGLDLAQYTCDNPDVKTLIFLVSTRWCPNCADHLRDVFCPAGPNGEPSEEEQLYDLNAEVIYVETEGFMPGWDPEDVGSNSWISNFGCTRGYRLADKDSSAGIDVIKNAYYMHEGAVPWAFAVRTSDMKITHIMGQAFWLDFIGIAEANNAAK